MRSRKHLLTLVCMVSALSAAPTVAMAEVNVVIGVAPSHYYVPRHGHILAPGFGHWQGHRHALIPQRRHHGFFNHHHNSVRLQRGHHYDSRSHWGKRSGHGQHWQDRGRNDRRGHSNHGYRRGHGR